MTNGSFGPRLAELEGAARHASERYRLYRAKAYGPRLTSPGRLRELERQWQLAERLLRRAKTDPSQGARPPGGERWD